jgi:branched-chain amino acid aminotransferase
VFEQTKWVWMDGACIPWNNATVHVSAYSLHYGTAVFEGLRCYETEERPAMFRLEAHLDRLYDSAGIHEIEIPYGREEMASAICEVVRRNGFTNCYVRPICYLSKELGLRGLKCPVEVVILSWPKEASASLVALEKGVRVTVSPWLKFHQQMMPTMAKACGQYLNSALALRDAMKKGFDDALMLDAYGFLAGGANSNLFIVRKGQLITNDEHHSIMMGITRDTVLKIAMDLGLDVQTRVLQVEDLQLADEAFLTGTAVEVTPIREVDGSPVGGGLPGPITRQIQQAFFDATVARNPRYKGWLSFIEQAAGVANEAECRRSWWENRNSYV